MINYTLDGKNLLPVEVWRRSRIWHGQTFFAVPLFPFRSAVFSLIPPVENLGFAHEDIRVMTGESSPWDLPTGQYRQSCGNVRCYSYSYPYILSVRSNEDVGPRCPAPRHRIPLL